MIEKKITLDPASIKLKLRLLKEFIDQHKITEAEQTVQNIKSTKASDIDILIANGAFSFLKKDQKKAKDFLNKVLAEEPKNIEALKWLAEEYRSEMNYFEASAIYYDMLKISNENMNESLCEVLTLDAHYAEAEPICIKGSALKKNPFFDIYLGIAAREKMNLKEAKKYFLSSLNIKETEMGRVCLGEVFAIEKNYPEAENSYKSALKIIPESTRAQLGLAWAYFNNKERVTALESFKKACSLEKTATSELRKAIKVLIDEKSEFIQKYVNQNQRCVGS